MKKSQIAKIFQKLMTKYTTLLHNASSVNPENADFARGQYYAMMVAYAEAMKIVSNDDYAREVLEDLNNEESER